MIFKYEVYLRSVLSFEVLWKQKSQFILFLASYKVQNERQVRVRKRLAGIELTTSRPRELIQELIALKCTSSAPEKLLNMLSKPAL